MRPCISIKGLSVRQSIGLFNGPSVGPSIVPSVGKASVEPEYLYAMNFLPLLPVPLPLPPLVYEDGELIAAFACSFRFFQNSVKKIILNQMNSARKKEQRGGRSNKEQSDKEGARKENPSISERVLPICLLVKQCGIHGVCCS